ncbi:DUF1460 domain-containing protein [candidate division KSB1 bacterium]|nr:DUF1460 domain-containing protein [candidate division KSB1 bacterium]
MPKRALYIFSLMLISLSLLLVLSGCSVMRPKWKSVELNNDELETAERLRIGEKELRKMKAKQLYKFREQELDRYLGYFQEIEPDLRKRVQHLARKFVSQPYQIFLLGEFSYEIYDMDPLYSLKKSDCVVFCEHVYAMALAQNWSNFFSLLQRIRYKNGQIGILTRNHYTVADWDYNNAWLVEDITEELAGDKAVKDTMIVDRARFFKKWDIGQDIPVDTLEWVYIPYEVLPEIVNELQMGDFVNIVRGDEDGKWVGHVGLITIGNDGTVNFLHSVRPQVVEQPIMELYYDAEKYNKERRKVNERLKKKNREIERYNAKLRAHEDGTRDKKEKELLSLKPYFLGFKFLRLKEDPISELIQIDGSDAPRITIPSGVLRHSVRELEGVPETKSEERESIE